MKYIISLFVGLNLLTANSFAASETEMISLTKAQARDIGIAVAKALPKEGLFCELESGPFTSRDEKMKKGGWYAGLMRGAFAGKRGVKDGNPFYILESSNGGMGDPYIFSVKVDKTDTKVISMVMETAWLRQESRESSKIGASKVIFKHELPRKWNCK